jgi:D-tagatose-1,6-bisphosphate aldolase subunit GatZ/KbaZ
VRTGRADRDNTPADILLALAKANRAGVRTGAYSVCSANRFVLETALAEAARGDSVVLIESTCNQVNQFGGYTGMTPAVFRDHVFELAEAAGCDPRRVIVGGDHLSPPGAR